MTIEIRVLGPNDGPILSNVAPDVFDNPVDPGHAAEFLADPRHDIVVALDGERVVGMASAVDYVHPDKPVELWINEVGVDDAYHRQGIGRRLMTALFDLGRELGCTVAWVGTEADNAAVGSYAAVDGAEDVAVFYTFDLGAQSEPDA